MVVYVVDGAAFPRRETQFYEANNLAQQKYDSTYREVSTGAVAVSLQHPSHSCTNLQTARVLGNRERNPARNERKATERRRGAEELAQRVALLEKAQTIDRAAEQRNARSKRVARKERGTSQRLVRGNQQQRNRVHQLVLRGRRPGRGLYVSVFHVRCGFSLSFRA